MLRWVMRSKARSSVFCRMSRLGVASARSTSISISCITCGLESELTGEALLQQPSKGSSQSLHGCSGPARRRTSQVRLERIIKTPIRQAQAARCRAHAQVQPC